MILNHNAMALTNNTQASQQSSSLLIEISISLKKAPLFWY